MLINFRLMEFEPEKEDMQIFNMQPLLFLLLVLSCIFKILFSPSAEPDSQQTDTELIVKFDKALYLFGAGLFLCM